MTNLGESENRRLIIDEQRQLSDTIKGLGALLELSCPLTDAAYKQDTVYQSVWGDDNDVNIIKGKIVELINKL